MPAIELLEIQSFHVCLQKCRSLATVKMTVCGCPAVIDVSIMRPDLKFQLGFSVKDGVVRCCRIVHSRLYVCMCVLRLFQYGGAQLQNAVE